ncbi:MAG: hypothetical protein ACREJC_16870, partial [Tepidisphaeraceae bacterium]
MNTRLGWVGFALLLSLLVLAAGGKAILHDTLDPDSFWHLRVADQLTAQGIGPLVDNLSFASLKTPWTPYSWLAELGMKFVWDEGSYRAAVAVQSILVAAIIALMASAALTRTTPHAPLLGVTVATAVGGYLALPYLSFRPVTGALVGLAGAMWLLVRDRHRDERSQGAWLLIPLCALLINVHPFALVIPCWTVMLLCGAIWELIRSPRDSYRPEMHRRAKRYLLLTALCALACCASPMLPGLVRGLPRFGFGDPMVRANFIVELRPVYAGLDGLIPGVLLLLAISMMLARRQRYRAAEWLWLA